MANPEHVAVVPQGAEAIAEWRRRLLTPFELDLISADLRSVNLDYADLSNADLREANLSNASLINADLNIANLSDANLSGANVDDAKLSLADLTGADLRYADLSNANLTSAELADADLTEIEVAFTVFGDVDLSTARGLSMVTHLGPSVVDHRTLEKSGQLPLEFLRGVGLPDEVIQFYEAQYGTPIQYYSSFISYARADGEFVDRLHAGLQENGVRC